MLSSKTKLMLFVLGRFLSETDKGFENKPLTIYVSKAEFISVLLKLGTVKKKERAIYRNLELLGKEKFIKYDAKKLGLTRKGFLAYRRMVDDLNDYLDVLTKLNAQKILRSTKVQTVLK
ncbi:MAG: hypothetical protein KJ574_05420 [Nanoarchaeota archaeon]|nr:hypothetical protein [Nanoarchaeota archaeon]